jgi:ubiquinone/menaquinone biosynthesis C-methylase UbiE
MTFLSPVGYLLGIEGTALLRGIQYGTADRAFVAARLEEIRALLDDSALANAGVDAEPGAISVNEVYQDWAPHYDEPNSMIELEEPTVREILDGLPVGTVLDAACGTARHGAYLAGRGHRVIGTDASPDMLALARRKLPDAEFHRADLHELPLPDASVDAVVCSLALSYVKDLRPVFAEFAKVLRPGGHLVVSDAHDALTPVRPTLARTVTAQDGTERHAILPEYHRPLSHYLAAALPLGLQVRRCEELRRADAEAGAVVPSVAPEQPLPVEVSWELLSRCPEASAIALDVPIVVVWHFQAAAAPTHAPAAG